MKVEVEGPYLSFGQRILAGRLLCLVSSSFLVLLALFLPLMTFLSPRRSPGRTKVDLDRSSHPE